MPHSKRKHQQQEQTSRANVTRLLNTQHYRCCDGARTWDRQPPHPIRVQAMQAESVHHFRDKTHLDVLKTVQCSGSFADLHMPSGRYVHIGLGRTHSMPMRIYRAPLVTQGIRMNSASNKERTRRASTTPQTCITSAARACDEHRWW